MRVQNRQKKNTQITFVSPSKNGGEKAEEKARSYWPLKRLQSFKRKSK